MVYSKPARALAGLGQRFSTLSRLRRDKRGTTAIEFAMVAGPFFLLAFGIMGIGLQFFTINALEHGVEMAARKIRTGQAQTGHVLTGQTLPTTRANFKTLVCNESGAYIKCDSNLIIHLQSAADWSNITPVSCLTAGAMTPAAGSDADLLTTVSGGASQVVLVTACYNWELGQGLWQSYWSLLTSGAWNSAGDTHAAAGLSVIQAATAFRSEPYE